MDSPQVKNAADFSRGLLAKVLNDLESQIDGPSKTDRIKTSLKNIRKNYQTNLSHASPTLRTDWNDLSNRFAYVFLYLLQHCHLVCTSLQNNSEEILFSWRSKSTLKVCCIGGGPGSDLVGLTTFLRENDLFPSLLECLVLDLYPRWKNTWDSIFKYIPGPDGAKIGVEYRECDVVRYMYKQVANDVRQFIQQADILTFVKSFSAVSAFFREEPKRGDLVRSFLRDVKPGCFVLYIDNEHGGDVMFEREFASREGLEMVYESRSTETVPGGLYPHDIRRYCKLLEYSPMRRCNVIIQLFRKKVPTEAVKRTAPIRPPSTSARRSQAQAPEQRQYRPQDYSHNNNWRESEIPRESSHDSQGLTSTDACIILGVGVGALLLISWWRSR